MPIRAHRANSNPRGFVDLLKTPRQYNKKTTKLSVLIAFLLNTNCSGVNFNATNEQTKSESQCVAPDVPLGSRTLLSTANPTTIRQVCLTAADWAAIGAGEKVKPLDLVILLDSTGSMDPTIAALKNSLSALATAVNGLTSDVQYGLAEFQDWGILHGGDFGDEPFILDQVLTPSIGKISTALSGIKAGGGGDLPESDLEALFQAATGEGDHGYFGINPSNIGWRTDSAKVVVLITDAPFKSSPLFRDLTRSQVKSALIKKGIKVLGISVNNDGYKSYEALPSDFDLTDFARATGALAMHDIDVNLNGVIEPTLGEFHRGDPLVFRFNPNGGLTSAATMAQIIASGLIELIGFQVDVGLAGEMTGITSTTLTSPMILHKGDTACFDVQINLSPDFKLASACSAGADRNMKLGLHLVDGTVLKELPFGIRLSP